MNSPSTTIMAVVDNLLTATRISDTAHAAGIPVVVVRSAQALDRYRDLAPTLVLIDLEASPDIVAIIGRMRSQPGPPGTRLVGFYPHVRTELRQAALNAGLDRALPRSVLHGQLAELLRSALPSTP